MEKKFLIPGMGAVLVFMVFSARARACSESGPKDFGLTPSQQEHCGKEAIAYATALAQTEARLEPGGVEALQGPYTETGAHLQESANAKNGFEKHFTLATTFTTAGKWECVYCVTFHLQGDKCLIHAVQKHFCSK